MKTILLTVLALTLTIAGVANATGRVGTSSAFLNCVSDSGRTSFRAEIGDIDGLIDNATFTIDGHSLNWSDVDDNSNRSAILVNFDFKVFTLFTETANPFAFVELIAEPSSMRISETRDAIDMQFRAMIVGTEPRPGQDSLRSKNIGLACVMNYKKP
jgi:hypothetical protein